MENSINNIEVKAEQVIPPTIIRPYSDEAVELHAAKCGGRRNLREIAISTDENELLMYLVKKPSRAVISAIAAEESKKEKRDINAVSKLLLGCVLEGDKEAYEHDGGIYGEILKAVGQLANTAKSAIKKI